jgi:hypothetical protein
MLDCPESCTDGSECAALRSADAILWSLSCACFMAAVLSGWINLVNIGTVSRSQHAQYFSDQWGMYAPTFAVHVLLGFALTDCCG